jgi:hypothetical protein
MHSGILQRFLLFGEDSYLMAFSAQDPLGQYGGIQDIIQDENMCHTCTLFGVPKGG